MIKSINTRSRNGEVADVLDSIINAYNGSSLATDPYLVAIFSELQPQSPLLIAAIECSRAESQLEEADMLRDDKIRALCLGVQSAVYNDDTAVKAAAQKVNTILDKYGLAIIDESYASESTLIKSMLNDLAAADLADAIAAVPGCAVNIAQLRTAQEAFTATSDDFAAAKSTDKQMKTATQLKKEIITSINQLLVRYLNGMQAVNNAQYGALANILAQLIADNNSRVSRRSSTTTTGEPATSE